MTILLLNALAAYRITRLLQRDAFPPAQALRSIIDRRGPGWLVELYECGWCLGFWVSIGVVGVSAVAGEAWNYVATALAISVVVGVLSERDAAHGDME